MRYCDYCGGVGFVKDECRCCEGTGFDETDGIEDACEYCEGTGLVEIDGVEYYCGNCDGTGVVYICGDCNGTGVENETCPVCAGRGYFDDDEDE